MEYRLPGRSGLKISVLTFGTMTFGGETFLAKTGATDLAGAQRQLDICLDAGVNIVDTANVYSGGHSEEILGEETARLDEVSQRPLLYPYWHQANTAASRPGAADLSLIAPHLQAVKKRT